MAARALCRPPEKNNDYLGGGQDPWYPLVAAKGRAKAEIWEEKGRLGSWGSDGYRSEWDAVCSAHWGWTGADQSIPSAARRPGVLWV